MTSHLVPTLDSRAAMRLLSQPRSSGKSSWLCEEIAQRMLSRLDWMNHLPGRWLHWEPVWGGLTAHATLLKKLPRARAWVGGNSDADLTLAQAVGPRSWDFWRQRSSIWTAESGPVDMLWANQSLHLQADPMATFHQWKQALNPQGYVLFSSLGPDTLKELRQVYVNQGWPDAMQAYTDMHDWGDMLVEAGFAEPVMDMETLTLTYANAKRLIADLRDYGGNAARQRFQGLRGKGWHTQLIEAVEADVPRTQDGQLQLTIEVIYGHAIKPNLKVPLQETTHVALTDMQIMLGQKPKKSR